MFPSVNTGPKAIGHYVVAHFVRAENIVKIYDSLHKTSLQPNHLTAMTRLYPGKRFMFVKPATLQPDGCSCGVFTIAYVTAILLGHNPATYNLRLGSTERDKAAGIRNHIKTMFNARRLINFPRE